MAHCHVRRRAARASCVELLDEIAAAGIENVLALRGDPPRGETEWTPPPRAGCSYSVELIRLIAERYDFCVGAAVLPGGAPRRAATATSDLRYAKEKVEAGAEFLITQLFFDNELYFDFVEEARAAGIDVPIIPGIMPITNFGQIKRFTEMCGATIPDDLERELDGRADDPEAVARARRRLRDPPVLRSAGAGRARHPLLHAEPLAGDARDPGGAAGRAAVGAAAGAGLVT